MRILGNVFPIPFVLPLLSGMQVVGNVFPDSLLVLPEHNGMNVVENVFPDSPLVLPALNGMNVVENVFKLLFPIRSTMNAGIIVFPTIHEGIKVSNETF
jgi:hypothetical protein